LFDHFVITITRSVGARFSADPPDKFRISLEAGVNAFPEKFANVPWQDSMMSLDVV